MRAERDVEEVPAPTSEMRNKREGVGGCHIQVMSRKERSTESPRDGAEVGSRLCDRREKHENDAETLASMSEFTIVTSCRLSLHLQQDARNIDVLIGGRFLKQC